jgi:phosphoribosylglycinamide formyltransferase 1
MPHIRLGFLASHNGSSMKAIIAAITNNGLDATPSVVISNNSDSGALLYAKENKIPYKHLSRKTEGSEEALDEAVCRELQQHKVDVVVMSGWMCLIGPKTLRAFEGKILNSHPALFSSPYKGKGYYGDIIHQAVLNNKEKETGVTIHYIDGTYDHGPVAAEERIAVQLNDTVDSLRQRVQERERVLYISVLQKLTLGG